MRIHYEIGKYQQSGSMSNKYGAFQNILDEDDKLCEFNTNELNIDLNNPLNIECQPSYDGTVNLIINDDKNPPRIINSRFTKLEDNKFKIVTRNQKEQTNLYKKGKVDQQTRLFRNINNIPKIDLSRIFTSGSLKCGNYIFYIKFADNDYNKTDIVAESSVVSIFHGNSSDIKSIHGGLVDEVTDKSIKLKISNIDTSFSKMYLYFNRESCDETGTLVSKTYAITRPYDIQSSTEYININGYEETSEISEEELNIAYNIVDAVKTQSQVQNMLFFGNIQSPEIDVKNLQNLSYFIQVQLKQDNSIGWVSPKDYAQEIVQGNTDIDKIEYYNPLNIYYKLGYWPDEIYRLGIVYIMRDDTLTPVFNLRGGVFDKGDSVNFKYYKEDALQDDPLYTNTRSSLNCITDEDNNINYINREEFLENATDVSLSNTFGVFKTPNLSVIKYNNVGEDSVKPIYFKLLIDPEIIGNLKNLGVKGLFIVRQKRIPTVLGQGMSIGIDSVAHIPVLNYKISGSDKNYITESFLHQDGSDSGYLDDEFNSHLIGVEKVIYSGLYSVDAYLNKAFRSNFNGSNFILNRAYAHDVGHLTSKDRRYWLDFDYSIPESQLLETSLTYINPETNIRYINNYGYSTKCGASEDVSQFSFFGQRDVSENNTKLLRGNYFPYIGTNKKLTDNAIYNIRIPNYSEASLRDYFLIRGNCNYEFSAITDRYQLDQYEDRLDIDAFRGDCFSNTVTIRINKNFVDSDVPVDDYIVDKKTWKDNYKGYENMVKNGEPEGDQGSWENINRADVNAVPLGMWITYKCLSNYHIDLRSKDLSNFDEIALMGNERSFYPLSDISLKAANKIDDSDKLNNGYNSVLSKKHNYIVSNVPYIKDIFENRIMFSNVQREDTFKNSYRIFQGLSYADIDSQYGAIVKLLPQGNNLLCVFEHGIGIVPVNEKALMQTTTGQEIHLYGSDVLQNQITVVSSDFGSIWQESIIKTPLWTYGVDTYAKKIWRWNARKGFECISDMRIQKFLNDNINLTESEISPIVSLRNVKTHYNNYKGDVMFTFYNDNICWNWCYNERMDKWVTRYSWTPVYSANSNNIYFSFDNNQAKIFANLYKNATNTDGIQVLNNAGVLDLSAGTIFIIPISLNEKPIILDNANVKRVYTKYIVDTDEYDLDYTEFENNVHFISDGGQNVLEINVSDGFFEISRIESNPAFINVDVDIKNENNITYSDTLTFILKYDSTHTLTPAQEEQINKYLKSGFYVHGRAGIFDEITYDNYNHALPTKWYDKQEPFEFEFVVKDEVGLHKIFDNLLIISNNVQPKELECEIIGDSYNFNKAGIYHNNINVGPPDTKLRTVPKSVIPDKPSDFDPNYQNWQSSVYYSNIEKPRALTTGYYRNLQELQNSYIKWDNHTNQYSIVMKQPCKNVQKFGLRLGNLQYKEDCWYITLDPIFYKERFQNNSSTESEFGPLKSVKLRDKFIKIRVKYTGEDLAVITALTTIYTQSYN